MNIEISPKEYRDLLDILHVADMVLSGHRKEGDKRTKLHRELIQKLYGFAAGEGLDRLISYDASAKKYVPTRDFEQSTLAHAAISEFGVHLFWEELINRLSFRDAAQIAGGIEHLHAMSDSERQHLEGPIRERYMEEFSANDVVNLQVIDPFSTGTGLGTPAETSD